MIHYGSNIPICCLVRPGPAESLTLIGESDTGLVLSYSVPNMMRQFPPGLIQQVRVSNQHEPGHWEQLDKIKDADKEVRGSQHYYGAIET